MYWLGGLIECTDSLLTPPLTPLPNLSSFANRSVSIGRLPSEGRGMLAASSSMASAKGGECPWQLYTENLKLSVLISLNQKLGLCTSFFPFGITPEQAQRSALT